MDRSCATTHPSKPTLRTDSSSFSPCVNCSIHILVNSNALPTIRRSVAESLKHFFSDSSRISRISVSFLVETAESVLKTLQQLSSSEKPFAADLTRICMSISLHCTEVAGHQLLSMIFSEGVEAIMFKNTFSHPPYAVSILARMIEGCKNNGIESAVFPDLFPVQLLSYYSDFKEASLDIALLLENALKTARNNYASDLLEATEKLLSCLTSPPSEKLFLIVCDYIVIHKPSLLMRSSQLIEVLKQSLISMVPELRALSCNITSALCSAGFGEELLQVSAFEYAVEGIRNQNGEETPVSLLLHSLNALKAFSATNLAEKWVYSLEPILELASTLDYEHIYTLVPIVYSALSTAPCQIFSEKIFESITAVVMRGLASNVSPMELVDGISLVLSRAQINCQSLHAILAIAEATADVKGPIDCIGPFLQNICSQFCSLVKSADTGDANAEFATLGSRILFCIFDSWAGVLEESIEIPDSIPSQGDTVHKFFAMTRMFAAGLDPEFVRIGSCQKEDVEGMIRWCWRFLPPRLLYKCLEVSQHSSEDRLSVQKYLAAITVDSSSSHRSIVSADIDSMAISEGDFLDGLQGERQSKKHSCSVRLCDKAIQVDSLDSICIPEKIADALLCSCKKLEMKNIDTLSDGIVQLRRVIFICSRYGLRFLLHKFPESLIISALKREDFSLGDEADRHIFHAVISSPVRSNLDLFAWDAFAKYCSDREQSQNPECHRILTHVCNECAAAESLTYSLMNCNETFTLAMRLLDVVEEYSNLRNTLCRALEKAGCLNQVLEMLRRTNSSSVGQQKYSEHMSVASFLWIFSASESSSNFSARLDVAAAICDRICREAFGSENDRRTTNFLIALLRYLIVAVSTLDRGRFFPILRKSNVLMTCLNILQKISQSSDIHNELAMTAASVSISVLSRSAYADQVVITADEAISVLKDDDMWVRLVSDFPNAQSASSASRVSACHTLLELLLSRASSSRQFILQASEALLYVITIACCSLYSFVREAAVSLLREYLHAMVMNASDSRQEIISSSIAFLASRIIMRRVIRRIQFRETHEMADILCLLAFIEIGLLDDFIGNIENVINSGKGNLLREPRTDEMDNFFSTITEVVTESLQARQEKRLDRSYSRENAGEWEVLYEHALGRHTVLWRRRYIRK